MNAIWAAIILAATYLVTGIIRWTIIFKVIEIIANQNKNEKGDNK